MTDAQAETLALAQEAATTLLAPAAAELDATEGFPTETLKALGGRGLMGINIAKEHGGRGAGVVAYAHSVRALATACPGTAVAMMVTNMVAEAIQKFADEGLKQRYLPRIMSGEWPAAGFCLSEPGAGSDAASLRCAAAREGDEYVLNGTKAWVTSGGHAGVYLVMARTGEHRSRGISAFLIEPGMPGVSASKPEDKMGLRASATTELLLENCRVPAENRVAEEGQGLSVALGSLDGGRIGVSAQAVGIASSAYAAALESAKRSGHGLDLLAECKVDIEAGWALCLRAAGLKDAGKPLTREAAMSKLFCTEMADRVCHRALSICGPEARISGHPVERALRDVRVTRIYEGTNQVQRIVVAREVLKAAGGVSR